ncbi:MAG: 5-oxoprolinase/urea amidolyase family protein [Actinobacteria bacterium]|nr:5-oxoprolinase/urea amidolyase family protein [Actinomycetota bacterium]
MMTTVQDWPGRVGLWRVGVPPSGPMDDLSFRLGNWALGNEEGAAGLECTMVGPRLRFPAGATAMVTGGECSPVVDGEPVATWEPLALAPGAVLDVGRLDGHGLRAYVLVAGGIEVSEYLGSASTFTLGGFGGHEGRALRQGDELALGEPRGAAGGAAAVPGASRPAMTDAWQVGVAEGPHGDREWLAPADIAALYEARWEVHFNSARTGVRLIGPKPRWSRPDGGEAGLHPSNIHDTPYTVGAVDFTGDMPILLGPDGPSLGGFVCPATVLSGERWKLGQMRPGDTVRFVRLGEGAVTGRGPRAAARVPDGGILARRDGSPDRPAIAYRRQGDDHLLVELQPNVLDLGLRLRVHALAAAIEADALGGVLELTEGIRALQVKVDPAALSPQEAVAAIGRLEAELPPTDDLAVPSRTVHLPLSWDDPATREAIDRYMQGVRADAPWCPWNIEFIRRINGLEDVEQVKQIVFDADYLVLGLGDVYLGAPVATPLDPRHRLVTTKYNPARTWTAENSVGIGGAYLCIYGMEGPGGYQFVGRTTQVWDRGPGGTGPFEPGTPWLLRAFDRINWFPVEAEELLEMREAMAAGRLEVKITDGEFSLARHQAFLAAEAEDIDSFRAAQREAFAAERERWAAAGEFTREEDLA